MIRYIVDFFDKSHKVVSTMKFGSEDFLFDEDVEEFVLDELRYDKTLAKAEIKNLSTNRIRYISFRRN